MVIGSYHFCNINKWSFTAWFIYLLLGLISFELLDSHQLDTDFALLRMNSRGCIIKLTYKYKKEKWFVERKCKEYPFESWSCKFRLEWNFWKGFKKGFLFLTNRCFPLCQDFEKNSDLLQPQWKYSIWPLL